MTDFGDHYSRSVHMYTMLMAHLNSTLNPLLYGIFNSPFKKGYKKFLMKITNKGNTNS